MPNTHSDPRSTLRRLLLIGLLAVLGTSGLLLRNSLFDTPIYASDEYAYLAAGKFYENRDAVSADDPGIQRISNLLYFRMVQAAFAITKDGVALLKFLNVVLYALVGLAFTAATLSMVGSGAACLFLVLYFLLPWSGYLVSIQPETVAYFGIMCAGAAATAAVQLRSRLLCGAAGLLTATICYIKPNAVGIAVGTALFFLFSFRPHTLNGRRAFVQAGALFTYFAGLYAGAVLCPWLLGQPWSWWPSFASGYYATELGVQSSGAFRLAGFCLAYVAGHLLVLSLLFPVGVCGLVLALKKNRTQATPSDGDPYVINTLARWLACAGVVSIVFVAYYSAKIDQGAGFETARLHGRYIGFIFPFLLFFTLQLVCASKPDTRNGRPADYRRFVIASILLLCAVVAWELFGRQFFKIYPWDYPELTALYTSENNYWHATALWNFRFIFLLAAGAAGVLCALARTWARYIAIGYLAFWMIVANRQNTAFQRLTTQTLGLFTTEARTLAAMGDLSRRQGVVIGSQRYGRLSYVLFGLAARARVLVRAEGSQISDGELPPGCEWVLCDGNFSPSFTYQSILATEHLSLFLLGAGQGSPLSREIQLTDKAIELDASKREAGFFGFNAAEPWGSWSSAEESFIQLPAEVRGVLRVNLRAWTGPENAGKPLRVRMGSEVDSIILAADPADYSLNFNNVEISNHLTFSFPVIQRHPWERRTGFALSNVSIIPVRKTGPESMPSQP